MRSSRVGHSSSSKHIVDAASVLPRSPLSSALSLPYPSQCLYRDAK